MKFRYARHTLDLYKITHFYCELVGLKNLGSFNEHAGYSGIFLGLENENWHLEFTVSEDFPTHHSDEDDLLVFYSDTEKSYRNTLARFKSAGINPSTPKNSYWNENGSLFIDPDGFGVIIAKSTKRHTDRSA